MRGDWGPDPFIGWSMGTVHRLSDNGGGEAGDGEAGENGAADHVFSP